MAILLLDPGTDATGDLSFWPVSSVVSGTIATDAAQFHTGLRSMKSAVTVATGEAYVRNASGDGLAAAAGRRHSFYLMVSTASPSQASTIFRVFGSSEMIRVELDTNGKLKFTGNAVIKSSTTTLVANVWYHISFSYKTTTVSNWSARVWINDWVEISADNTDGNLTAADADLFMFGLFNSAVMSAWFDDVYIDDGALVNNPGNIIVVAKRPFANGTLNQFTTQIGVGGSGYGTGHAPQVNEVPVSATNGWSLSNTAVQTEEYTIEDAATGDTDISRMTILGYGGWIRALVNSVANTPVHHIILNGVATSKTMTTSAATYATNVSSTTYPSSGAAIGMDAQYTTTPHLTSLLECGVIFALIAPTMLNPKQFVSRPFPFKAGQPPSRNAPFR